MVVVLALGSAVLGSAVPAGAAPAQPSQRPQPLAQRWYHQVMADLSPLDTSLVAGLQVASQWQNGQKSAAATAQTLATVLVDLHVTLHNLHRQKPLSGQATALADYTAAVDLYLQAFQLEDAATQLPPGQLVTQLQRSFERIRQLGDITYDVGTSELAPLLGTALAGSDVRAARELPDWTFQNLAPGPPLESSWSGTRAQPSGTQSLAGWVAAIRADHVPPQSKVSGTLERSSTTTDELSGLARALQHAEVGLASVRSPKGDGQASPLLRLGLLVDAEAALAAEASDLAGLAPHHALREVASSLAAIGAALRSSSIKSTEDVPT